MCLPAIIQFALLTAILSPVMKGAEPEAKPLLRPRPLPGSQTVAEETGQTFFRSPFAQTNAGAPTDSVPAKATVGAHIGLIRRGGGSALVGRTDPPPSPQTAQTRGGDLPALAPGKVRVIGKFTTVEAPPAQSFDSK